MATTTKTTVKSKPVPQTGSTSQLKTLYYSKFIAELEKELKLKNVNQVPKLQKIVINTGLGRAKDEKKILEVATNTIRKVTGQQPIKTTAKKAIATFKLRQGNVVGLKVTLRGDRMYEFMDRLINLVLPRLRDFHGVNSKAFDPSGNYAIGIADQSVFPELSYEETTTIHGMQVIFVVDSHEPAHSRLILEKFGMPFEKENTK